jgi:hypothetical protein
VPIPTAGWSVVPTPALVRSLAATLGDGCLRLNGPIMAKEENGRRDWGKVKAGGTIGARA